MNKTLIVKEVIDEGDRVLIFGDDKSYHIISPKGTKVEVGSVVSYEPYGFNFGWFVKVIK